MIGPTGSHFGNSGAVSVENVFKMSFSFQWMVPGINTLSVMRYIHMDDYDIELPTCVLFTAIHVFAYAIFLDTTNGILRAMYTFAETKHLVFFIGKIRR